MLEVVIDHWNYFITIFMMGSVSGVAVIVAIHNFFNRHDRFAH